MTTAHAADGGSEMPAGDVRALPPLRPLHIPASNIKQNTLHTPPPRAHARRPRHEQTAGKEKEAAHEFDVEARYNQHVAPAEHVLLRGAGEVWGSSSAAREEDA
jgi:hypothetical protein